MKKEFWKETEYKDFFISSYGNIKTVKKGHKPQRTVYLDKDGYCRVWIGRKFVLIHRLVAKAFIDGDASLTVNHKNGVRTDNNLENLEWLSRADNERHARRVLGKKLFGQKASRSKLKNEDIIEIRILGLSGAKQKEIASFKNISQSQVNRIIRRANWGHL